MKKRVIIAMTILTILLIVGCSKNLTNPSLKGFYHAELKYGNSVGFSFQDNDNTFVVYINSIEINKGTYDALGDGEYILKGEKGDLEIKLEKENYFNLEIEKLMEIIESIEENERELLRYKKVLVQLEKKFSEHMPNICPLCGQEIK